MMLAAVASASATCGSAVIALALHEGEIEPEAAWVAAQVDETFQSERWGEDEELARRGAELRHEIEAAGRFMRLGRV